MEQLVGMDLQEQLSLLYNVEILMNLLRHLNQEGEIFNRVMDMKEGVEGENGYDPSIHKCERTERNRICRVFVRKLRLSSKQLFFRCEYHFTYRTPAACKDPSADESIHSEL